MSAASGGSVSVSYEGNVSVYHVEGSGRIEVRDGNACDVSAQRFLTEIRGLAWQRHWRGAPCSFRAAMRLSRRVFHHLHFSESTMFTIGSRSSLKFVKDLLLQNLEEEEARWRVNPSLQEIVPRTVANLHPKYISREGRVDWLKVVTLVAKTKSQFEEFGTCVAAADDLEADKDEIRRGEELANKEQEDLPSNLLEAPRGLKAVAGVVEEIADGILRDLLGEEVCDLSAVEARRQERSAPNQSSASTSE